MKVTDLQVLVRLPFFGLHRAMATLMLQFGTLRKSLSLAGKERIAGDYGLHMQCPYEFARSDGSTTGIGDIDEYAGALVIEAVRESVPENIVIRVIARGRDIAKVDELVSKFGGQAKNWIKKSTLDQSTGIEIHWYEHRGIGRVGEKWAGFPDPF